MVRAAEEVLVNNKEAREEAAVISSKPTKKRVSEIANTAYQMIGDEDKWSEPKREGSRKTLAEHQTAGAKHLANTILIEIGNKWSGPDAQLDER